MKKISKKTTFLLLAIFLFIISTIVIIVFGDTYTIKIDNLQRFKDIENINIKIEDENIIECIGKKVENGILKIKIKSKAEGKTFIAIKTTEDNYGEGRSIYVHKFGIITFNEFMGDSNGSIIIPISFAILLMYALYLMISAYKNNLKTNMYQYKNIAYLGLIIFTLFVLINQIFAVLNYNGLIKTIEGITNMFSFMIFILPIAFIVSILVIISNISLIKKEGFNFRNMLGILLGAFLCMSSFLPEIMYRALYSATWIDIHNQNGIDLYIYNFAESIIYISITYIECVLIGTIIMGIKSAKHIPKYDKDYIVILGCQIKKDGTLTNLLKGRVDRAIEFSKMQKEKTGKDIIFVPSGGQGEDEVISEAQAMKNYLLGQGIKEENILMEDKSKNTFENIKFSNKIIKEKETKEKFKVAFSTTNYHVFRAGSIANEQKIYMEGIGSKTKPYFWINAFIREFIATMYSERKKHILIILGIILFDILMIAITYFNNSI